MKNSQEEEEEKKALKSIALFETPNPLFRSNLTEFFLC